MTEPVGDDLPQNDPSIDADLDLFRRVPPEHYRVVDGEFVLKEGAFKNFPRPERKRMSVALGDRLKELERQPDSVRPLGRDDYGVVALKARAVRAECQRVIRSPTEEEPAHGDVCGDKPPSRRKRLVPLARWVVYPTVET